MVKMLTKEDRVRRKILNILPRHVLEKLSLIGRPHLETKEDLILAAVLHWDRDEVAEALAALFKEAN